jgi:heterodisulfide reductase subunit C/nitrate reductase gamma subunit
MIYDITLYLSLSICILGLIYRTLRWFRISIGPDVEGESAAKRIGVAGRTMIRFFFSWRILILFKIFFMDILFQARLFQISKARWLFHFILFLGFFLLVFMHAMDDQVTRRLFSEYESTLNPFMFLRNLFGILVLLGVVFFVLRRIRQKPFPKATNRTDLAAILILFFILISGFLLEAVQIFSSPIFDEMVLEYMGTDDPEEVAPLQAYWAKEYGVIFPKTVDMGQPERITAGQMIHEESCAVCHSRPESAFVSYPLSIHMRSFARALNSIRADIWLRYFHFITCFIGLAYLPFSKFFHLISIPLNLIIRTGKSRTEEDDPNKAVKRSIGMDACTHCGVCSLHCSVMPIYRVTGNPDVLPSEKLLSVKKIASGKQPGQSGWTAISDGSFACTDCGRCTEVCPSGIYLHDLWQASKKELERWDHAKPDQWIRKQSASQWETLFEKYRISDIAEPDDHLLRNMAPETFSACIQCTVCANVCPVVSVPVSLSSPEITPQQVMNLLRLDMRDLAMGSRMVWDCMTCYLCQEHCPQGIKVTDILYELRNMGAGRMQKVRLMDLGELEKDTGLDCTSERNGE